MYYISNKNKDQVRVLTTSFSIMICCTLLLNRNLYQQHRTCTDYNQPSSPLYKDTLILQTGFLLHSNPSFVRLYCLGNALAYVCPPLLPYSDQNDRKPLSYSKKGQGAGCQGSLLKFQTPPFSFA
jgi:hypothetical protein